MAVGDLLPLMLDGIEGSFMAQAAAEHIQALMGKGLEILDPDAEFDGPPTALVSGYRGLKAALEAATGSNEKAAYDMAQRTTKAALGIARELQAKISEVIAENPDVDFVVDDLEQELYDELVMAAKEEADYYEKPSIGTSIFELDTLPN